MGKIRIFESTSEALKAYFKLAEVLGFEGLITELVLPNGCTEEDGLWVRRVVVANRITIPPDFLEAAFIFRNDPELGVLQQVDLKVKDSGGFIVKQASEGSWERTLLVAYPFDHDRPYFYPPEVSLTDFRKMFGPGGGRKAALRHYFRTGQLPERE